MHGSRWQQSRQLCRICCLACNVGADRTQPACPSVTAFYIKPVWQLFLASKTAAVHSNKPNLRVYQSCSASTCCALIQLQLGTVAAKQPRQHVVACLGRLQPKV